MHDTESPLAGTSVKLRDGLGFLYSELQEEVKLDGQYVEVDDWRDRVSVPWMIASDSLAHEYAIRQRSYNLPDDNEVLYCHLGKREVLIHVTEIDDV